ncbi:HAMP domain-containing protein [Candidatus Poribacteria bacterium]|nr:HAMP domain-containing protein [Candidatus Poribacteria bacterium]
MAASVFIGRAFDRQIRGEAEALKARISNTLNLLVKDVREKIEPETTDPVVVRAIRDNEPTPLYTKMEDNILEILEYGDENGSIVASKGEPIRRGEEDSEALERAQSSTQATIRLRTSQKRATIEVTLPMKSKPLGFVTGGYFLGDRLGLALKDQILHPIFLREGDRLVPLNPPADGISKVEWDSLLTVEGFQKRDLGGNIHTVNRFPPLENMSVPVELIIGYSHQNEFAFRRELMLILMISGGVGLVVVYVVSYVIGIQMTKPINRLAAGAAEIASGNLDHRITVQTQDEIGQLTQQFNQMAMELQVSQEKRLAAERVAAWRDVARGIAHEIKNPLFPIQLSVQNLQKAYSKSRFVDASAQAGPTIFDEIFDECTETVIEEVTRLQRMVDEFHQFARMPAPEKKPSDLNQIVRQTINLYAESAPQVTVETALGSSQCNVSVDPEQISQMLGNLIKNAIEAMPDGGALRVSTKLEAGRKVQIEIQDTGIGMSSEMRENLFTPYYTTKVAGTGLGMAIVQRIVTDHDGEISIDSTQGVGTRIRIELPIVKREDADGT